MSRRLLWTAAIGAAVGLWWCGGSEEPSVTVTVHVKLAAGADDGWAARLPGVELDDAAPLFARSAAALAVDRQVASARSGEAMPDLAAWQTVRLRGRRAAIDRAVARLAKRPGVAAAFLAPRPELAVLAPDGDGSCPIRTPEYHERQGYLGPAPAGIDARAAWERPGGLGEAVWFADVEGAWNATHEDLHGERIVDVGGRPIRERGWEAHGTAVLGEVAARDNNELGMIGIAPGVERIVTASIGEREPADAIDAAQAKLRPGDVLLIELHAIGPRGRYLPMEYWDDVYEAIRIATARGVVVVEAAGNGAENLDHARYRGRLDRGARDSGAIMVGAGAPAVAGWQDRSRLDFSNFGSRVDVQGWGRMVATLDYGDLQGCDANHRKYTARFSGTSSASPVVAGAALLVQSVYKTRTGRVLSPVALRALLTDTGTPQTDGPHGPRTQHIGPRPDLRRALDALPPRD